MADNWQPFPLPDGSYSDPTRPWSHQDLVNYLPVRAEMPGSVSAVNRRTAPGLKLHARLGAGPIRGARDVEGRKFFVSGTSLYEVRPDGTPIVLGEVPGTGLVFMTHNQVAGGNQIVIVNGSAGYIYDTRDDSLRNPATPDDDDDGEGSAPGGGTPSTGLGPNGGYPDDDEPSIPLPTTFGSNLIPVGDFSAPGDLDDWKNPDESDLSGWTIVSGAANYSGTGPSKAVYFPARYRMSPQPFPRYSVSLTGDLRCDADAAVAIGMIVGYNTAGDVPTVIYTSTPATYATSTPVTHTFDFKQQDVQVTGDNVWMYPSAAPVLYAYSETGASITADFDNITMEITEVVTPVTTQTLAHLDFASGLTGWTVWPVGVGAAVPRVEAGELILEASADMARTWVVNDDPISLADELNKYVHVTAEAWCNDPTTRAGITQCGVALGIIYRSPEGAYGWPGSIGAYERGDWTEREVWKRQGHPTANIVAGWTAHLCIGLYCTRGHASKVRGLSVEVTDSAVTS